jgi:hypothetical protein
LIDFTSQQDRRLHLNVGLVTAGDGHRSHPFHFVVSQEHERSLLEAELRRELQVGDDEIAGGDMPPFCRRKAFQHGQRLLHRRENGNSRVVFAQHLDHSLCMRFTHRIACLAVKRLLQIGEQVVSMFKPDGDSHRLVCNARGRSGLRGH